MWQENNIVFIVFGNIVKFEADDTIAQVDCVLVSCLFSQICIVNRKQTVIEIGKNRTIITMCGEMMIHFYLLSIISCELFTPSEQTTMIGSSVSLIVENNYKTREISTNSGNSSTYLILSAASKQTSSTKWNVRYRVDGAHKILFDNRMCHMYHSVKVFIDIPIHEVGMLTEVWKLNDFRIISQNFIRND